METEVDSAIDKAAWLKYTLSLGVGGAAITAFLIVCGKQYTEGYLSYWYLKEGMFSIPLYGALLQSFDALVTLGVKSYRVLLLAFILVFTFFLVVGVLLQWVARWKFLENKIKWLTRVLGFTKGDDRPNRNPMHIPLLVTSVMFFILFVYIGLAIHFGLIASKVHQTGFEVAQNQHRNMDHDSNRSKLSKIFQLGPAGGMGHPASGELVNCFNQRCIVLSGSEVIVVGSDGQVIVRSLVPEKP